MAGETMIEVQSDLAHRVGAIRWQDHPASIAADVDAIRAIAHRHGMHPAVTVAHCLETALARGERGALVHGWLALLKDAVASERHDAAASTAFAAACSVRLSL